MLPDKAPAATVERVLRAGWNCWKIAACPRLAFLVDGKSYFDALAAALDKAERRIMIVGWDFDSRIALRPDREAAAQLPLGKMLRNLVEARPQLEVLVLIWRYALFYGRSGEALLPLGQVWWRHPRIKFRLDSHHPIGACQHQKIVTIDDQIAFVGGIDLTQRRWDDTRHAPENPNRRTISGAPHPSTHDIQVLIDGDAARAVAEIAAARWQLATGETLKEVEAMKDPWPAEVEPAIQDHPVAVARTQPAYGRQPAAREIAALNMDLLAAARDAIYIETQYFALPDVAEFLARSLQSPKGPEIIVVTSGGPQGMFERYVMAENRDRMLALLHKADRHGRLRTYFPIWNTQPRFRIKVHSKLIIIDDRLLRIGSSNLNARSLGFDTECDLAIEAENTTVSNAITSLRDALLAEHLGIEPWEFIHALKVNGSVVATIDQFNGRNPRMLATPRLDGVKDMTPMPGSELLDPRRPLSLKYIWRWLTSSL